MLDKKNTRQHFERAAKTYDAAAVLQREVAKRLSERLDYIKHQPARALDIGCGTGFITDDLLKRYPKAEIIALDVSLNMLQQTTSINQIGKNGFRLKITNLCLFARMPKIYP